MRVRFRLFLFAEITFRADESTISLVFVRHGVLLKGTSPANMAVVPTSSPKTGRYPRICHFLQTSSHFSGRYTHSSGRSQYRYAARDQATRDQAAHGRSTHGYAANGYIARAARVHRTRAQGLRSARLAQRGALGAQPGGDGGGEAREEGGEDALVVGVEPGEFFAGEQFAHQDGGVEVAQGKGLEA